MENLKNKNRIANLGRYAIKGKNCKEQHPMFGKHHSKESIEKLRLSHLGQISNKKGKTYEELYGVEKANELKKNMWKNRKVKHLSEETKRKMSIANKGKLIGDKNPMKNPETRKKVSETIKRNYAEGKIIPYFKGKKFSEEHKKHMSIAFTGVPNLKLRGKKFSEERRAKLSRIRIQGISEGRIIIKRGEESPKYGKTGELSSNWMGGKSFEPYGLEFNEELKKIIRIRDSYTCQECGKTEQELFFTNSVYNRILRIHHIDYNKNNNSQINLISLCLSCHLKTNGNRKHWENYFKMKMFIKELFNPQNILSFKDEQLISMEKIR